VALAQRAQASRGTRCFAVHFSFVEPMLEIGAANLAKYWSMLPERKLKKDRKGGHHDHKRSITLTRIEVVLEGNLAKPVVLLALCERPLALTGP